VRAAEVRRVYRDGRRLTGSLVVLLLAPGPGSFAVVAARHVGNAVERNRARRIMREAWRQVSPQVTGPYSAVLVARGGIRGAATQDLVNEMKHLLVTETTG
jgi:ribonuclease P protein component